MYTQHDGGVNILAVGVAMCEVYAWVWWGFVALSLRYVLWQKGEKHIAATV